MTVTLDPDFDARPLMAAVVIKALEDATCRRWKLRKGRQATLARMLDAMMFLAGPDAALWLEAAGLPDAAPVELLRRDPAHVRKVIRNYRLFFVNRSRTSRPRKYTKRSIQNAID